jgi:hypothetical protein
MNRRSSVAVLEHVLRSSPSRRNLLLDALDGGGEPSSSS